MSFWITITRQLLPSAPDHLPLQHHLTQRHTDTHSPCAPQPLSVPPWLGDFGSERTSSWCGICSTSVIVCWTKLFLWVEPLSGLPPNSSSPCLSHTHMHVHACNTSQTHLLGSHENIHANRQRGAWRHIFRHAYTHVEPFPASHTPAP